MKKNQFSELNRREFLGAALCATLSGCMQFVPKAQGKGLALQLFSIREVLWKDPERVFAQLKAAGYDGVETAGFDKYTAKQMKAMLDRAGLRCAGMHVCGDEEFAGDGLKRNLDALHELEAESLVDAWADFETEREWVDFGVRMGEVAEAVSAQGIRIGIHNHFHEFTKRYQGVTAWDVLFSKASPKLCQQVDMCQVVHTGADVLEVLKKYPNRHYSVHMKENVPSLDGILGKAPTDGGPMVPWDEVIATLAPEPDLKWWIVECERLPATLDPAVRSAGFLLPKLRPL